MNVVVVETIVRSNGRRYPVGGVLPEPERWRAIKLAHALVCRDKLSYRRAQQAMLGGYAVRRSLGQVFKDVRDYECPACAEPGAFTRG